MSETTVAAAEAAPAAAEPGQSDAGRSEAPQQSYMAMKANLGAEPAQAAPAHEVAAQDPATAPGDTPAEAQGEQDAGEQPRGPDGRFLPKDGETPPADAAGVADQQTDPAAAKPDALPDGFKRFELPEGHPLRARGRTHFEARADTPEAEAEIRSILAAPVRAQEVEQARGLARQHEQRAVQLEASLRAANEFNARLFAEPAILSTYSQIGEEHGEDAARQWLDGLLAREGQNAQQYLQEAQQQAAARQHQEAAQGAVSAVMAARESRYPDWGEADLRDALAAYGSYLEVKGIETFDQSDFHAFADARYIQHPAVQKRVREWEEQQRAAETKRIADENAARERERYAAAERLRAENPMGSVPASLGAGRQVPVVERPGTGSYLDHKRELASR